MVVYSPAPPRLQNKADDGGMMCQVLRLGSRAFLLDTSRYPRGHKSSRFLSLQKSTMGGSKNSSSIDGEEMQGLQKQQGEKPGDAMANSFGEAYATRSEDEGFGGIYGESQTFVRTDRITVSEVVQEGHSGCDNTQGSTVNETKKGRNSTKENTST